MQSRGYHVYFHVKMPVPSLLLSILHLGFRIRDALVYQHSYFLSKKSNVTFILLSTFQVGSLCVDIMLKTLTGKPSVENMNLGGSEKG